MAKSFSEFTERLQKENTKQRIEVSNTNNIIQETQTSKKTEPKNTIKKKIKAKQGRPCIDESKGKKRNYCKTINIAIPKEEIEKVQSYALNARGVNLTEYINLLVEQDLKKNLVKYKKELSRNKNFD